MESDLQFDPAESFAEVSEILESLELSGGWQIIYIDKGITYKQRKDIDNDDIYSSETFIQSSPDAILEAITDFESRSKWDLFHKSFESLENWGKNLQLIYYIQNFKWPLSDRDFITIQGIAKDPDSRITVGWKSVRYDKKILNNSLVRGRIVFAGFVITKVDEETSHVSFYEKSFSNVSVPDYFEKKMQVKNTEVLLMLKNYLTKDKL